VRGVVLNSWSIANIELDSTGNTVAGCFIGTDSTGLVAPAPGLGTGVSTPGASNTIGGLTAPDRNLISGNRKGVESFVAATQVLGNLIGVDATGEKALENLTGIDLSFGAGVVVKKNVISGNQAGAIVGGTGTVQQNLIGLSASGSRAVGNVGHALLIIGGPVLVGGTSVGDGNVISGNLSEGLGLSFCDGAVVHGNFIGTDATGTAAFGNAGGGIRSTGTTTNSVIGGTGPGEANVIAFNASAGIALFVNPNPSGNSIRGNSIHDNSPGTSISQSIPLGIDLGGNGPTANDPGDADPGANLFQNYPFVFSAGPAVPEGTGTRVQGVLHSQPSTEYALDFYSNPACAPRPRYFAQAKTYLGAAMVSTDGAGDATFDVTLASTIAPGETVVATATDPAGNTSEISPRIVFTISLPNGPPAGGSNVTIHGTDFEPGAALTIGGAPATDVAVTDAKTITATTPALAPGSVGDVTVVNPSGLSGTFPRGWVSDFLDASEASFFYPYVVSLVANGVTAGCGGGNYCPSADVTRAQMAVFLLKGKHGLCYTPPPCGGAFTDVACPSQFADWIEALATEGITGGCGGGNYCPGNPVRRDQMAVFLLKASHGSTDAPPACAGAFSDVACPSPFADWIEQLAAEQITGGCGTGIYCPLSNNTRGQMAVFLTKTFTLQ